MARNLLTIAFKAAFKAAFAAAAFTSITASAQDAPLVGLWKNIDDRNGKPKALIRITESNGEFRGKIEKLYIDLGAERKCVKCEGSNKDQPIIGMTVLTGLKRKGSEYVGGEILDPANGKTYKTKMTLVEGGKKLDVRGYIGVPLLGRTQTWIREE